MTAALSVATILFGVWFLIIWLPHRVHVTRIGVKYGWPSQKRIAIKKLLLEGVITEIVYVGGSFNPGEEFSLIISGSFGTHICHSKGGLSIKADPSSAALPPEVDFAFSGYLDRMDDVVWLLWHLPFLDQLKVAGPGRFKIGGHMPQSLAIVAS